MSGSKRHKKRHKRHVKRHNPARRCEGCKEDDLKVVPVVLTIGGRRRVAWNLCRACAAGKVIVLTGKWR